MIFYKSFIFEKEQADKDGFFTAVSPVFGDLFCLFNYCRENGIELEHGPYSFPSVTGGFTKLAWKRDNSVPIGQPAPGHFDCKCGHKVLCPVFGQAENVTCPTCEQSYDGRGWKVSA